MKRQIKYILWLILFFNQISYSASDDSCRINIDAEILKNSQLSFGYYYGSKTFLQDYIQINNEGKGVFSNKVHKGIFFLLLPDSSAYEIMINEKCNLNITINNYNEQIKCTVKGNPVTEAYDLYVKKVNEILDELTNNHVNTNSSVRVYTQKNVRLSNDQKDKIEELQKTMAGMYPGTLLESYLTALLPVEIADLKRRYPGDSSDLSQTVDLYRIHYLDNLKINDERLIYTPILSEKLNAYLDRIISQQPDTVVKEIINLYSSIKNLEVKRFFLENQMDKYGSNIYKTKQEYIYYTLIEKLYLKGLVPWENQNSLSDIRKEYDRSKPVLYSQPAPEINLSGIANESNSLLSINSEYILVIFWDLDCPLCTRIIKDVNKTVSSYNYLSLKVFTVCINSDFQSWVNYSIQNLPKSYINTIQLTANGPSEVYNISKTPTLYLLDRDKKIIQKNFTNAELDKFLLRIATGKSPVY